MDNILIAIQNCKDEYMCEVWKFKRNELRNMITILEHERREFNE